MLKWAGLLCALLALVGWSPAARAEDGYELWLRHRPLVERQAQALAARATALVVTENDPRILNAADVLHEAIGRIAGTPPHATATVPAGAILLGTPASPRIAALGLPLDLVGEEGFVIRTSTVEGKLVTVIAANRGVGVLYGAFHYLRLAETGALTGRIDVVERPRVKLRVLDHWDNLDRSVERGYAGDSIWDWWKLPGYVDPRYTGYARANASIGVNGAVLNNVNAQADSLTAPYLAKAAAVADVLRPWGMKVYLSARFSAPIELGCLKTADPLDPAVRAWWRAKTDEIYRIIPDFGGFLVKANSEGQPGPRDYRRTHADGANMLAGALHPHGGVVMWRAFVYAETNPEDRAKQAFSEFRPLDGRFADNVLVQVKNGPIDFQPREPFHPLFGAMPRTPLMIEFQITKEYLGFATHLVYLGTLFAETLCSDTYAKGPGSTVASIVDGSLDHHKLTGIAGVSNIGSDRDWTGSTFDQANWYAFERFAWDPDGSAKAFAEEWAAQTFTPDPRFVGPVVDMMLSSRQAAVDYMTPLGLAHQMGTGHHYGPEPWVADLARPEWNPAYYHRADRGGIGIGFDRTVTGSDALAQFAPAAAKRLVAREDYLLWFHHVPWDWRMLDGATLWNTLVRRYDRGVASVTAMRTRWDTMRKFVDAERFEQTARSLRIQQDEAEWWRDASVAYFASVSGRPLPPGVSAPPHPLDYYQALRFPNAPGQAR